MLKSDEKSWRAESCQPISWQVVWTSGLLAAPPERAGALLGGQPLTRKRLVVIDATVHELYGSSLTRLLEDYAALECRYLIMDPAREKTLDAVAEVLELASDMHLGRSDAMLGIGGGWTMDVTGVSAAQLHKGTSYDVVPTTVVGLVDAGIAAKRAIDYGGRRNLIGAYYAPRRALCDPGWLLTLPSREARAGMGEMLKVAEAKRASLFHSLEQDGVDMIDRKFAGPDGERALRVSLETLLEQLADDPYERNRKRWPSFGHEMVNVFEMAMPGVIHGEVVSAHCVVSTCAGHIQTGNPGEDEVRRTIAVRQAMGLPCWYPEFADPRLVEEALRHSASVSGGSDIVVIPEIGEHAWLKVSVDDMLRAADLARQWSDPQGSH